MAGQNGYITSSFDHSIPSTEFGAAALECDVVGYAAVSGRTVLKPALAAAGGTQVKGIGIVPRDVNAGGFEAIIRHGMRIALPATLPAVLNALKPGDPVYLSDLTAGAMTQAIPVGAGKVVQVIGYGYYTSDKRRGIGLAAGASGLANGIVLDIQPAVTI